MTRGHNITRKMESEADKDVTHLNRHTLILIITPCSSDKGNAMQGWWNVMQGY